MRLLLTPYHLPSKVPWSNVGKCFGLLTKIALQCIEVLLLSLWLLLSSSLYLVLIDLSRQKLAHCPTSCPPHLFKLGIPRLSQFRSSSKMNRTFTSGLHSSNLQGLGCNCYLSFGSGLQPHIGVSPVPAAPGLLSCQQSQQPLDWRPLWHQCFLHALSHHSHPLLFLCRLTPKTGPLPTFPLLKSHAGPHLLSGPGALLCFSAGGQGSNSWPRFWILLLMAKVSFPSPCPLLHSHTLAAQPGKRRRERKSTEGQGDPGNESGNSQQSFSLKIRQGQTEKLCCARTNWTWQRQSQITPPSSLLHTFQTLGQGWAGKPAAPPHWCYLLSFHQSSQLNKALITLPTGNTFHRQAN